MKGFSLILLAIYAALVIGWVLNIYKLCKCDFEPSYKAEVIRIIGIPVAPVGAIVGWIDLGK